MSIEDKKERGFSEEFTEGKKHRVLRISRTPSVACAGEIDGNGAFYARGKDVASHPSRLRTAAPRSDCPDVSRQRFRDVDDRGEAYFFVDARLDDIFSGAENNEWKS